MIRFCTGKEAANILGRPANCGDCVNYDTTHYKCGHPGADCDGGLFLDTDAPIVELKRSSDIIVEECTLTTTQQAIIAECDAIKHQLLEKNRKYGDSAVHPIRVFSQASPIEQINVRLDDKLSRLMSGQKDETEDVEFDLVGYIVLKRVARRCYENTPR